MTASARRTRRKVVAVIGDGAASPELRALAAEVGRLLGERGCRLVTGGLGGVMEAASQGARSAATYHEGDVIGIVPGSDPDQANPFVDVVIPSGLGIARNALVVQTADAVVAVGGGSGTLSEIAMAWQLGKPVIALAAGGWSERVAGTAIDARRGDTVQRAESAEDAVEKVVAALGR